MKFQFLIAIIFIFFQHYGVHAQINRDKKFYTGGTVNFSVGNQFTAIGGSPLLGYKITEPFSVGVTGTILYNRWKVTDASLTHFGGSLFARYTFMQQFFVTTEYEYLSLEYFPQINVFSETTRIGLDAFYIGGGMAQPIGRNATLVLIGLYNVLYDAAGINATDRPFIVRSGINIGF